MNEGESLGERVCKLHLKILGIESNVWFNGGTSVLVLILYSVLCIDSVNVALTCGSSNRSTKSESTAMKRNLDIIPMFTFIHP